MMLSSLCQTCLQPFELILEPADVTIIRSIADEDGLCPCPRLCGGKINIAPDPTITAMAKDSRMRPSMALTGQELYRAVNGMGLPDEIPKTIETVEAMLLAYKVVSVDLQESGGRFFLNELHLSNGVVVHLTSGLRGCLVLKLTKKEPDAVPTTR